MSSTDNDSIPEVMVATKGQTNVVDVRNVPWQELSPGARCKVLYKDDTGISVVLFNFAPGVTTPLHMHTGLECTYVLEGSLQDHDSAITAGNFAVRIAGSVHQAHAPQGCTHIAFFTKPVRNVDSGVTAFSGGQAQ